MNSIFIRADSGTHIGTGHIMRCMTLGRALIAANCSVYFICRAHIGNINALVSAEFTVLELKQPQQYPPQPPSDSPIPHSHWLGVTEQEDAAESIAAMQSTGTTPDWFIIDHFAIGAHWELHIKQQTGSQILVIDGLLDHAHHCDLLIDPTLNLFQPHKYSSSQATHVLTGPANIPLRAEFRHLPLRKRRYVRRILVCFGGVDVHNITLRVCKMLTEHTVLQQQLEHIDVVVGKQYPALERLRRFCHGQTLFLLHEQTDAMASLMQQNDLAIGAGGTMAWERCAAALPAIVVSIAQNQLLQNKELELAGAVIHVGTDEPGVTEKIAAALTTLCQQPDNVAAMSEKALALMPNTDKSINWIEYVAGRAEYE